MRIIALIGIGLSLSGCASATRGWTEQIALRSSPEGAQAVVTGAEGPSECTTPCEVKVKRNADVTVSMTKPGYEPYSIALQREVAPNGAAGVAGNILVGGLVGVAVDAASGAAMDHKPNPVVAQLVPTPAPRSSGKRKKTPVPTS